MLPIFKDTVLSLSEDGLAIQVRSFKTDQEGGAKIIVAVERASESMIISLSGTGNFSFVDRYAPEEQGGPPADEPDEPPPYSVFRPSWESAVVTILSLGFSPPTTMATLTISVHEKPEPNSAQNDSPVILEVLVSLRSSGATCYISRMNKKPAAPPLTDLSS